MVAFRVSTGLTSLVALPRGRVLRSRPTQGSSAATRLTKSRQTG